MPVVPNITCSCSMISIDKSTNGPSQPKNLMLKNGLQLRNLKERPTKLVEKTLNHTSKETSKPKPGQRSTTATIRNMLKPTKMPSNTVITRKSTLSRRDLEVDLGAGVPERLGLTRT